MNDLFQTIYCATFGQPQGQDDDMLCPHLIAMGAFIDNMDTERRVGHIGLIFMVRTIGIRYGFLAKVQGKNQKVNIFKEPYVFQRNLQKICKVYS